MSVRHDIERNRFVMKHGELPILKTADMIADGKWFSWKLSEGSALLIDRAEELRDMLSNVLGLVDSQAQKIADLNRVGSNTLLALIEAQEKIAEQAKEIERLTKERDDARKLAEDFRDDEYDNDMDLSLAENRIARREYAKNHPLPWEKQ